MCCSHRFTSSRLGWMGRLPDPKPPASPQPLPCSLCRHFFLLMGFEEKTLPEAPSFRCRFGSNRECSPRKSLDQCGHPFLNYHQQTTGSLISVLPAPPVPRLKVKAWVQSVTVISPLDPSSNRLRYGTRPIVLAFDVTKQPPPMKELSPYDIHPPHLDGHLESKRGEFRLEKIDGGKTRLIGTTWHKHNMWPATYWRTWSDFLIGRIHQRVLESC